jgi:hypothetical protein
LETQKFVGSAVIFSALPQKSAKVSSYFAVYDRVLGPYRGLPITFVEIGVAEGGSLLMWREFFGPHARIVGIDLDPAAAAMRAKGFEIFIGDQASSDFWRDFFTEVGDVDIILDDGGHTNKHQISTVENCIGHVKDGGVILVEDVGTSYLPEYGNPSRYSFINYARALTDRLQWRGPLVVGQPDRFTTSLFSIAFFESVVCFYVERRLCKPAEVLRVGSEEIGAVNRWNEDKRLVGFETGRRARKFFRRLPRPLADAIIGAYARLNAVLAQRRFVAENRSLRRFF